MRGDAARLIENVAASVADGARVDWERAGAQVSGRELRLVRHLRLIDSLAEVYRTLPPLAEDDGTGARTHPDYPDGPRWGRLILLNRIGRGASADVFRAFDAELQREVALKLLHEDGSAGHGNANARLIQEARRLARIRHPHVVHVYGAEAHEGRIGLWMELARGRSLDAIVREDGPLAVAEAAHIGIDLCSALATVHGAGLLHRDVKAQNVLREDDGRTLLMDFGTGEEISDRTPRLAGTPIYLAPEIMKHGPASVQSDLYAVGVLLFHLVTGEFPVKADSIEGLQEAHRDGGARPLREVRSDVPAGFARVVDRALSIQPSKRYASATAMEAALRQALDDLPGQRKPARGWWLPIVSIAIAAATLVGSLATRHPATPASGNLTSLAVLPLKFVSGENEAPYLADALTDQLITTLGQIHSIKVMAQTSVSRFKGTTLPIADIAKQLNVDGVIEGTVAVQRQAAGAPARARVNVRVVRAGTDLELWSGSLERPVGDMMALEAELARTIARQIHGALNPQEARQLRTVRTTSPEADQAYLQGRYHLTHSSAEARLALEAFQRALQFDPNHASAHAGAARSYIALGFDNLLTYPQSRAAALADATRAVELDPDLAEAHAVLADLKFYYDWDWHAADREYQRAVNLEPSSTYARSQYARYLSAAKRVDEAVSQASMAATLDPLSSEAAVTLGLMLHYARRDAEAVTALERALSLDPGSGAARFVLGRVHEAQGKRDEAIAETDRAIASADHIAAAWTVQAVCLRARAGRVPEARATFSQLLETLQAQRIRFNPEYEGKIRLALGEVDRGMTLLEQAVAERDPAVLWFAVDPRLDPYRTHPRFTHVIAQLAIP